MDKLLYWLFGIELGASPDVLIICAQILGLLACVFALSGPHMKHRRQMFLLSCIANLLTSLNLLLFALHPQKDVAFTACIVNGIAVGQTLCNYFRDVKSSKTPNWEKILFAVLYLSASILPIIIEKGASLFTDWHSLRELLPIAAIILFMICGWFKREQSIRLCLLGNTVLWLIYYCLIGSSLFVSQTVSAVSIVLALLMHWKDTKKQTDANT